MGIPIDQLASAVMEGLEEYANLANEGMKAAVRKSAKTVRSEISANAPRRTGKYAGSWATQTTAEGADQLEITVYSKKPGMPHLLEHGHAKRNGGRVGGHVHIAPAEQAGIEQLESEIVRSLQNG